MHEIVLSAVESQCHVKRSIELNSY